MKHIQDLEGKTIAAINPIENDFGVYMLELIFTDSTVLKIEREHSQDHYLEWRIE